MVRTNNCVGVAEDKLAYQLRVIDAVKEAIADV